MGGGAPGPDRNRIIDFRGPFMCAHLSRRSVLQGFSAVTLAGMAGSAQPALARQQGESSGLGLTREEFESIYGPGQAGQSFQFYRDPVYGAELHVGLDEGTVDYFWISMGDERTGDGLPIDDATSLVDTLLPGDARIRESYLMNESPGSLAQVEILRLTSRWLDDTLDGRSSILVTLLRSPDPSGGMVATRATIVVEQR
jgi:hypothetical protein